MSRRRWIEFGVACLLVVIACASRVLKEAFDLSLPNFHAVSAVALFAGYYFRNMVAAVAIPLVAMMASDLVFGGYETEVMIVVYGALVLPVAYRSWLKSKLSAPRMVGAALASSAVFFIMTNLAVWHAAPGSHSWAGLVRCYAVALPFFKYTIAGDLGYAAAVFGAYAFATAPRFARGPVAIEQLAA